MDDESFEKQMSALDAKIENRSAYLDNLRGAPNPSVMTPTQYAFYSHKKDKLEHIEENIAKIEGDNYGAGFPPEDDGKKDENNGDEPP